MPQWTLCVSWPTKCHTRSAHSVASPVGYDRNAKKLDMRRAKCENEKLQLMAYKYLHSSKCVSFIIHRTPITDQCNQNGGWDREFVNWIIQYGWTTSLDSAMWAGTLLDHPYFIWPALMAPPAGWSSTSLEPSPHRGAAMYA